MTLVHEKILVNIPVTFIVTTPVVTKTPVNATSVKLTIGVLTVTMNALFRAIVMISCSKETRGLSVMTVN